jgi:alpha-glucuronidase
MHEDNPRAIAVTAPDSHSEDEKSGCEDTDDSTRNVVDYFAESRTALTNTGADTNFKTSKFSQANLLFDTAPDSHSEDEKSECEDTDDSTRNVVDYFAASTALTNTGADTNFKTSKFSQANLLFDTCCCRPS